MITLKPYLLIWSQLVELNEQAKLSNNINVQNADGNTLLHLAVISGDLDTVKALQQQGAKCLKNNAGQTPLFTAVQTSATGIIDHFLATWPIEDILIKDNYGWNAMIGAIYSAKAPEVFKSFLADPRLSNAQLTMDRSSWTPLMYAVSKRLTDSVKIFLQYWSTDNILATNDEERNILHIAAENEDVEMLKLLLSDPNIKKRVNEKDIYGLTPLDIAAQNEDDDAIAVLCDDSNIDATSIPGYGKPLAELDQNSIYEQLTAYMNLFKLEAQDVLDSMGNCNGFEFLYQIYFTATGSDKYFYTLLSEIKKWDRKEESLNETNLPAILKKNFPNTKAIFEQMIHHLAIFQAFTKASGNLQLGFNQGSRKQQYNLMRDPNLNRTLKDIFYFSNDTYNKEQLEEIIKVFSHWPGLSIDLKSPNHAMTLYITENRRLQYYDPNPRNKIPAFDDAKALVKHIVKYHYKKDKNFDENKINVQFQGYKFYHKNEKIPTLLQPNTDLFVPANSANKWSDLHYALMENNLPKIKNLLQMTDALSLKDAHNKAPLRMAVRFRNEAAIELIMNKLMTQGENTNQIGQSLNFEELLKLKPKFILSLLEKGFLSINTKDITGSTLLQQAANLQDPKMLNTLMQVKGLDINATDNNGRNALMIAIGYDTCLENDAVEDVEYVEYVEYENLDEDIDEDSNNKDRYYPIHHENIKKLIVREDLDINAKDKEGWTVLMSALEFKLDINLINMILNREDLNINQKENKFGANALMLALAAGADKKIIARLVEKGAQVDFKNNYGENSLMYAVSYGADIDTVKRLLKSKKLNINSIDNVQYRNVLMFAIEYDCPKEIIKLILETGIRLDHKDKEGQTAFDYAKDKPEIKELLDEFQIKNQVKSDGKRKAMHFYQPKSKEATFDKSKPEKVKVVKDKKFTKKY